MSMDDLFYYAWRRIMHELLKNVSEDVQSGIRELLLLMERAYREQTCRAGEAEIEAERMKKKYLNATKKQTEKLYDKKTEASV